MKTLTIRGLPQEVHENLKRRAAENRRSLNQEIIAELVEAVEGNDVRGRVNSVIASNERFRGQLKNTLSEEEIREAIDDERR
jgi:plasmid stability protein